MLQLLFLLAGAYLLAVPAAFWMALRADRRARALESQVGALERRLQDPARRPESGQPAEAPAQQPPIRLDGAPAGPPPATDESPTEAAEPVAPDPQTWHSPPDDDGRAAPAVSTAPQPAPSRASLLEAFGARWSVWVGGVALALGGVLLVRYSIEQGYFGPLARCLGGLAFGAALIVAGETLRRREAREAAYSPIPAVVTAAGTVAAFAAIYAAHGLYDLIGPATAFVALGAVALAAMAGAALHGPALAGLGLAGALATPLLVESSAPNPWPVALYVAVVAAASFGLARVRRWLWLAAAGAVGASLWVALLSLEGSTNFLHAGLVLALAGVGAAGFIVAFLPHVATQDEQVAPDWIGAAIVGAFALAAAFAATVGSAERLFDTTAAILVALIVGALGLVAALAPAVAVLSTVAGLLALVVLAAWTGTGPRVFDVAPGVRAAGAPQIFAAFAAATSALVTAFATRRIWSGRALPFAPTGLYALAATVTPLAALALCYVRLARAEISLPYAAIAGLLAAVFALLAGAFRTDAEQAAPARKLPLGAFATAALGALALGFVFALDKGMLTVALALTGLAAAWLSARFDIGALRWASAAMGLVVLARIAVEPRIVGAALGTTPIFNWLLFGYGVPALAFFFAARFMRRAGGDERPVMIAEALAIILSALLIFFETRHAMNDGDIYRPLQRMAELGLLTSFAALYSALMIRLDARRANPVYFYASYGFAAIAGLWTLGLLGPHNPLLDCARIEGAVVNTLIVGLAAPALTAGVLRWASAGARPLWFAHAAGAGAVLMSFAYVVAATRRIFGGAEERICAAVAPADLEVWTHSAVWLAIGCALLVFGLLWRSQAARLVSAFYVFAAVLKIFLYDLSGLEGLPRALSFIVLGLTLIGIGLLYQRLLFRPASSPPPSGVV